MKYNKRYIKLLVIILMSITSLILLFFNFNLYVAAALGEVESNLNWILSFFTITTTLLSIFDIKKYKRKPTWTFVILFGSSIGTLIYSSAQLYLEKKGKQKNVTVKES